MQKITNSAIIFIVSERKKLVVFADLDRATLRSEDSGEEFALASQVLGSGVPGFDPKRMVATLHRFKREGRTFDPHRYFQLHNLANKQMGLVMRAYVRREFTESLDRRSLLHPDANRLIDRVNNSPQADLCFVTRGQPVPQRVKLHRERLGGHYSLVVPKVQKGVYIASLRRNDGWRLPKPFEDKNVYDEAMFFDDLGEAHVGVPDDVHRFCINRPEGGKVLPGGQLRLPGVVFIESLDEITHPALAS